MEWTDDDKRADENDKSYKAFAKKFLEHTKKERSRWDKDLNDLFPILKETPERMYEMEAVALSYRHLLSDEIAYYMSVYYAQNAKIRVSRKDRYVYYSTGYLPDGTKATVKDMAKYAPISGMKATKGEKDMVIDGDLSDHEYLTELLDSHVAFLRDGIKSIDHLLYAVKNKIEILRLMIK